MRALCLVLILCGACAKKPPVKAPPPAAEPAAEPAPAAAPPGVPIPEPMERKGGKRGDPCEGGEKPH
jgi:hypothetical protein